MLGYSQKLVLAKKIMHLKIRTYFMLEKISPPPHPQKIMVHLIVHRGGLCIKVSKLRGGEHRNKFRCF